MRNRFTISTLCALLCAGAISACGGSSGGGSDNGVSSKSASDIVTAATNAMNKVSSLHVSGSVSSGSAPISLDLDLVSGKGGRGTMSESGLSFQIIVVSNNVYINGSPAFWQHFGGAAAAKQLDGKWLKTPATGDFASLAQLANLHTLLGSLLASHGATLTKGAKTTVNGHAVIGVKDSSNGGTLYVATTGQPYPIEVVKGGTSGGTIKFDSFDQSFSLTPPANSIDISSLASGG
jgi:hypothetical protein